jgi:Helicase HerA, central domain
MSDMVAWGPAGQQVVEARGYALPWHEGGWGSGLVEMHHVFASREITAIGRVPAEAARNMRDVAYSLLSTAALMPACDALEVRFAATPDRAGPARVQMFVTAKSCGQTEPGWVAATAAVDAAVSTLPVWFRSEPVRLNWADPAFDEYQPIIELRRLEEITSPQWEYVPADFFYVINDDPGDGSGWPGFWQVLPQVSDPVIVSLLFKQTDMHWSEQQVLASIVTQLQRYSEARAEPDILGNQVYYPADLSAEAALVSWKRRMEQLRRPVLCRVAIRGSLAASVPVATALAASIAQTRDRGNASQPMFPEAPTNDTDSRAAAHSLNWMEICPWGGHPIWAEEVAPHSLRRLPYLFGLEQAAGLAVLPTPDDRGVPGFQVPRRIDTRRAQTAVKTNSSAAVSVGEVLHFGSSSEEAILPLHSINRHVLVAGTPGSGKTTTVLAILAQLWEQHHIPFLVIEPTKAEYRTLLRHPALRELRIVSLGRDDLAPFRLNLLAPPPGVRCETHIGSVLAAFKAALPLPPPLPQLLEDALERSYTVAGWSYDSTSSDEVDPPTLRGLLKSFDEIFEAAGYIGEARNVAAALRVRLRSLLRGSRGRVFDTVESVDFEELLRQPTVVELHEVDDLDDKALMAILMLDRLRASAKRRGSSGGQLRHVTVIEEAHRLLPRGVRRESEEGTNTRAAAVEAYCDAIAELRAYGEGFVICSQMPSRLAEAAVANASARIVHRLESAVDRDAMLTDFDAPDGDREAAARLSVGEAIVKWPPLDEPQVIRVVAGVEIDSSATVTDEEVRVEMAHHSNAVRQLLPFELCTRVVCSSGCGQTVRSRGEAIASSTRLQARQIWEQSQGTAESLDNLAPLLLAEASLDPQTAYCGAAHLARNGDALIVRRPVDIRPRVISAIQRSGDQE